MTEQQAPEVAQAPAQEVPPQPAAQPKAAIDPVQFEQIKKVLTEKVMAMYGEFCKQVRAIPCHPHLLQQALHFFDQGYLNFKEGVQYLSAELLNVVQAPPAGFAPPSQNVQPNQDQIPDGAKT